MAAYDPFKVFEGWEDTTEIKAEVERAFAEGARVDVPTLRRALSRVVAEGYYGPPPGYGPGHHVRWCLNHHPGYNPNTNLFPDRFGALRPCEHP